MGSLTTLGVPNIHERLEFFSKNNKDRSIQFFHQKWLKRALGTNRDSFERFDENQLKYSILNQAFKSILMKEKGKDWL